MAKKNRNKQGGALGAIVGLARAGKDAGTIKNKKAPKKERQAARKRLNAYNSGNRSVYVPKQARPVNRQAKLRNIQKAQQKTAPKSIAEKKPELTAYQKYQNALNQQKKIKAAQATKKAKLPLSNAAYKEQQKQAKKEVKRVQSNYTLTGLKKNTEQAGISAKKAQERAKKEKPTQLSPTGTALKLQYLSRLPKAARDKGVGDNLLTEKEKKQVQTNIQADYSRGSIGTGFMSGSMPVANLKKATEKAYGIKLDDSKANEKLGYKIGEAAGYLAKSTLFGGAGEAAVGRALTKVIAKKTGKQVTSKAAKFGINRASEAIASAPVNVEDAAKNSKDAKEFVKNLSVNAALDAGLGSTVDVVKAAGRAAKMAKAKTIHSAIQKTLKGQDLTESEASALAKVKKRAEKKRESGKPLNTAERLANKAAVRGQAVKQTPTKATAQQADPAVTKPVKQTKATALERNTTIKASNPVTKIKDAAQGRKADKAFSQQVDDTLTGNIETEKVLTIGRTPRKLQQQGASDIDMTMKQGTVRKVAYPSGYMDALKGVETRQTKGHNLGVGTVKQIRKELESPVAILKSDTQKDSFVVFINKVDTDNNPVMVAVHLDKQGRVNVSNEIASIYGRANYNQFIENQRKKGNVLYENKKTGLDSLPDSGLQLPVWGDKSDPINTLYQNGGKVNNQTKSNPESPKIGDTVDDVAVKNADQSETMVDLETDPAVRNIVAGSKSKQSKETGSLKQDLLRLKDNVWQKSVDSLYGIEVAAKRVGGEIGDLLYHQANALRQCAEKANYSLKGKQTDFDMQVIGKGAMEILRPVMKMGKNAYEDFNAYLFHNLNIDRFKNGKSLWGEDVISEAKSRQIVKQFDDAYPEFRGYADEVIQYFRNLNNIRVDSGLLSTGGKFHMEHLYENYVPAFRNMDKKVLDKTMDGIRVNRGIFRAKGGPQEILPIHEQMAYATQQAWQAAELNHTIRTLAEAQGLEIRDISKEILEKGGTEEALEDMLSHSAFFKEEGGRVQATYFVDGKAYQTEVDRVIYNGLKEWTPKERHEILDSSIVKGIDKGLTSWNNLHKALITTYNFFFTFRNLVKDLGDALWYAERTTDFVKNIPGAVKSMATRDTYWQLWNAAGGRYSGLFNMTKVLNPKWYHKANPLKWIHAVNDVVEQYPRMVEFRAVLRKEMKKAGITDPKQCTKEMVDRAAHAGADITCNFGRVGSFTKPLNRTAIPFLNASIQGADKMIRVLKGQKGVKGYAALATKLLAIGVTPAVTMEILYANDESFQDFNTRDKDSYFLLKDDSGAFWAIPLPRGASSVALPAQMFTRKLLGNGEMSADEFTQKWMNDVAPVSPFDASIFMPFINMFRGGDAFMSWDSPGKRWYGADIESRSDSELPKIERYSATTSKIGKAMSESMYKLIKKYGNEELAETYTLSPKKIDHFIDSYSGIVGDVALAATQLGGTQAWYHQIFNKNMMRDPVYSNHLSEDYYNRSDELNKYCTENGKPKKGATIEQFARGQMFKNNNIALSDLRDLQQEVRMDPSMSREERGKKDRILQIQINNIQRRGVDEKAIQAFDRFIKKHKDEYMTNKGLIKAAQREYEKHTHATVKTMDVLYQVGGIKTVLKGTSSYVDENGDKQPLKFSNEKSIGKIYKSYKKDGGKDDDFYKVYREMKKRNTEQGIGTNSQYGNLAEFSIRSGGFEQKTREKLRKAFGVTKESKQWMDEYYKAGGSRKEYLEAAEASEALCNSLKQKDGTGYNFFAPFAARGIATKKLPDRAYMAVDSAETKRKAIYYINNSRGLEHYKISGKTLQEIDNKSAKDEKGYTTSKGLQKVLDKTKYSREEKALIWEALYGLSYAETNPYGSIRDFSLKTDVGIDTSGGWKEYGKWGYRRYGRRYRRYGRRGYGRSSRGSGGSSGSTSAASDETALEKYERALKAQPKPQKISVSKVQSAKSPRVSTGSGQVAKKASYTKKRSSKLDISAYGSDALRKAVVKLLAKQIKG